MDRSILRPVATGTPAAAGIVFGLLLAAFIAAPTLRLAAQDIGAEPKRQVFEPNWESLNSRQSPEWFRDAKLGIFIHWGVYSVPAICHTSTYSEWYRWWYKTNSHGGLVRKYHDEHYGKDFAYHDFAPRFRAELWKPREWAQLFKRAGARYVVLVSKHHDGFALWPNEHASKIRGYPWNSVETGPKRDLCGDLTEAVRAEGLKMGFYFSLMEWDNPLYDTDKARYVAEHMIPQIRELVKRYRPAVFWPDGEWNLPDTTWRSPEVLAWIYNNCDNPEELVVNDRWGRALRGQTGDYYTTEYGHVGGGSPGLKDPNKPFEECRGIGHSFAFNRLENYDSYLTREGLIRILIEKVSRGGGLLLNIGPTGDGRIPVIQQDRLIALGEWLEVNGDAIYGTRKSVFDFLPWGKSTTKGNTVYLHVYDWPANHRLTVPGLVTPVRKASLLHDSQHRALKVTRSASGESTIDLLGYHPYRWASVIVLELAGPPVVSNVIRPDGDGKITLTAERAKLHGSVQLEANRSPEGEELYNVGYWSKASSWVAWQVEVLPRTRYRVELEYASEPKAEGGEFVLELGKARLAGKIAAHTGGWKAYRTVEIGAIVTGQKKAINAAVRCRKLGGGPLMNLRRITLTPVR